MRQLYELQQLDLYLEALRQTLKKLDPGDHLKVEIERQRAVLEQIKREYDTLHAEAIDQELQLRTIDEKLREAERELYSGRITNPKELAALEKDIALIKQRRGEMDIRVLEMWEKMETLRQRINESERRMSEVEQRYEAYREEYNQRKAALETELQFHEQQREMLAHQIDPEALARYELIRQRLGGVAVVRVVNKACDFCHTVLTPYLLKQLEQGTDLLTCESCARLLYWQELDSSDE